MAINITNYRLTDYGNKKTDEYEINGKWYNVTSKEFESFKSAIEKYDTANASDILQKVKEFEDKKGSYIKWSNIIMYKSQSVEQINYGSEEEKKSYYDYLVNFTKSMTNSSPTPSQSQSSASNAAPSQTQTSSSKAKTKAAPSQTQTSSSKANTKPAPTPNTKPAPTPNTKSFAKTATQNKADKKAAKKKALGMTGGYIYDSYYGSSDDNYEKSEIFINHCY